jgi:hypothetical protein
MHWDRRLAGGQHRRHSVGVGSVSNGRGRDAVAGQLRGTGPLSPNVDDLVEREDLEDSAHVPCRRDDDQPPTEVREPPV